METLYWIIEYARVIFAFLFILFVWPSVVFRKYLKGKNRTFCFAYCATVMVVLINTVVLVLGLVHILNVWAIRALFWGVFIIFLIKDKKIPWSSVKKLKYFFSGTYGWKSGLSSAKKRLGTGIADVFHGVIRYMKGHWFDYILLLFLVLFGVAYFSVGVMHDQSYGFGDLYVHHEWIYGLTQGNIFEGGVYPEGMHCFVYCENAIFGISIQSCLLFTAGIQSAVILVSIFIFLREMFNWKYTPYIVLALFLTVDLKNNFAVTCMSRWQWTMPQEFGFPALFLCAAYLVKHLRNRDGYKKLKMSEMIKDENIIIFTLSFTATLICHFYTTILAFYLCVAIVIFLLRGLFSKKIVPLILSVILGCSIAIVPMVGAYLEGIPLQGSLTWALEIMGIDTSESDVKQGNGDASGGMIIDDTAVDSLGNGHAEIESDKSSSTAISNESNTVKIPLKDRILGFVDKFGEKTKFQLDTIYEKGYVDLYGEDRGEIFIGFSIISLVIWLVWEIVQIVLKKLKKDLEIPRDGHAGYGAIALASIVFTALFCAQSLEILYLIEWYRVCVFSQLFSLAIIITPLDMLGLLPKEAKVEKISKYGVIAAVLGIYVFTRAKGIFHGYLMFELTRYNSCVSVMNSIMDDMGSNNSFTIVSTTDEYYQQVEHGFHEEIINFVNESHEKGYTIPSKYVYIFVEKKPIARAQYHVFTGPRWLADEKYAGLYGGDTSQCPAITSGIIVEGMASVYFDRFPLSSTVYNTLWQRVCLMSKLYVWCQKFNAMYPGELHTYYEDDNFVCYYFVQNERNLYELSVFDDTVMIPPNEYPNPIWPSTAFE